MKDIKIFETGNGGSIELKGKDLVIIEGLHNMIYLALFGGNMVSTPSKRNINEQNFDFWANTFLKPDSSLQFNSKTEKTLNDVALNSQGRQLIQNAVLYDLDFLKKYGTVTANVSITGPDKILIEINIQEPNNSEAKEFKFIWDGTKKDFSAGSVVMPKISDSFSLATSEPVTVKINGNIIAVINSGNEFDIEVIDTSSNIVGNIIDSNTVVVPAASTDAPYQDQDVFGNFLIPTKGSERPTNYNLRGADWADQFLSSLTSPSPAKEAMILQLCDDLETADLWKQLYALYPFMGDNAADNSLNLKYPFASNGGNVFWQGSPTHGTQFVQGNGTNAMGIIPISYQIFNPADFSMGAYLIDSAFETTQQVIMGFGIPFSSYVALWTTTHASLGGQPAFTTNLYGQKIGFAAAGSARGIWSCDINASRRGLYLDGILKASSTFNLNLSQVSGTQIQILSIGNGNYSSRKLGLTFFAKSMDDSVQAIFNTIIQTLITAKGV